jgi:DNA replication ATP-dependent helicase Dna2
VTLPAEHTRLLHELGTFVRDERDAALHKLLEIWNRPLAQKLHAGWSQQLTWIERGDEPGLLRAQLDEGHSRFREGDLLVLHTGHPIDDMLARGLVLEAEDDDGWLLRGKDVDAALRAFGGRVCYADADTIDLTDWFKQVLEEIESTPIGREVVLPLLAGTSAITFVDADVSAGERAALARGFNAAQAQAVGLALGAEQLACIQGPPGTGKTAVLALAVRLMVERGERVLVTSHTHMAINNALNKVAAEGVPVVKIGVPTQRKGLDAGVPCHDDFAQWARRPRGGWVVGATPFATMTQRLEGCEFETIVFDEASQVTLPLALMAMRKGRRFVFVGDHRQLPPVMQSRSVLDEGTMSAFETLTSRHADHGVMLDETYRMNRWLAEWPSRMHYGGRLRAAGPNRERRLKLSDVPARFAAVLDPDAPGVFVPTLDRTARSANFRDAELIAALCAAVVAGGLAPREIGIVTPYRAQGRALRNALRSALGARAARDVVADTVERMQGQERELVIVSLASGDAAFLAAVAGFLFQPQRLNVAITRARSKLIVIGPEPDRLPQHEHPEVQRWILQYADFVGHLRRVPCDGVNSP